MTRREILDKSKTRRKTSRDHLSDNQMHKGTHALMAIVITAISLDINLYNVEAE